LGFYRRNRSLFLLLLGAGLMATSPLWEYVRMKPDYRYIVSPWALRGWHTTPGLVIAAFGVAAIILGVPLALRLLKGGLVSSLVVAVLAAVFITLVPVVADASGRQVNGFAKWCLALFVALALMALVRLALPSSLATGWRRSILFVIFAGATVAAVFFVFPDVFGDRQVPLWILALIVGVGFGILALSRRPFEIAPHRLLIDLVSLGWAVALFCAGAVRSTLLNMQLQQMGIAAEYRDIQMTAGVLIAWAGGLLAFAGAVALWARRRDELAERTRAGRQLAVAEISARELQEAV
jgi:uncharacterized membrane protein